MTVGIGRPTRKGVAESGSVKTTCLKITLINFLLA